MIGIDSNNGIYYRLEYFLAGTYLGTQPTWTNVNSGYSVAQYASNLGTGYNNTNAITLYQGYFFGKGSNTFSSQNDIFSTQVLQVTSNISNQSDMIVLTATQIVGNTATVYGTIKWQELY